MIGKALPINIGMGATLVYRWKKKQIRFCFSLDSNWICQRDIDSFLLGNYYAN
jgi:hypothetical protein